MPGLRFKLWPLFGVKKFPWVQVPAGEIGVVIAQVGEPLPIGAKSARLQARVRQLLQPAHVRRRAAARRACSARCSRRARWCRSTRSRSSCSPRRQVYGLPVSPELATAVQAAARSAPSRSGCHREQLQRRGDRARRPASTSSAWSPRSRASRCRRATSPAGSAASTTCPRWRRPTPVAARRPPTPSSSSCCSAARTRCTTTTRTSRRSSTHGGKIGLQHDPLLYGAYLLNPFLVQRRPGADARREPGRGRGDQGLRRACRPPTRRAPSSSSVRSCAPATAASGRSRCAPASTRSTRACYAAEIVPTSILTLNWADATSRGAQPRRAAVADRGQEPRGLRVPDRPAGADPRARHQGAEGHLDGRHDAQPRERGAAVARWATTSATRCRHSKR